MRLFGLYKSKTASKTSQSAPARNFVAKNAQTTGAGSHSTKKYSRKEKHKNQEKKD